MAPSIEQQWMTVVERALSSDNPLEAVPEGAYESSEASSVAVLAQHLDDADLRVALNAGVALAQMTRHAKMIVPLLVSRLDDPDPLFARHLAWVIRELGPSALSSLLDAYEHTPARRTTIARVFEMFGPRAAIATDSLRRDGETDALRQIIGAWPDSPDEAIPYVGEAVRIDADGPLTDADLGFGLWLRLVQSEIQSVRDDDWSRRTLRDDDDHRCLRWCPDQVAIARGELKISAFDFASASVVSTTVFADDGTKFTKLELLAKALDAYHRIAPNNDRIFEGLGRKDDGSYCIDTGS